MDPRLVRVLMVGAGVLVGVAAELWLKWTDLYAPLIAAAGALIGNSFTGPGQVSVQALERLRPPSDPPPRP
jgi:hypothetical protein